MKIGSKIDQKKTKKPKLLFHFTQSLAENKNLNNRCDETISLELLIEKKLFVSNIDTFFYNFCEQVFRSV